MNKEKLEAKLRVLRIERSELEKHKAKAVSEGNYRRADQLQDRIDSITDKILEIEAELLKD